LSLRQLNEGGVWKKKGKRKEKERKKEGKRKEKGG